MEKDKQPAPISRPERIDTSSPEAIIEAMVELARFARREGNVMQLNDQIEFIEDEYMKFGLQWCVDAMKPTHLKYTLEQKAKWALQREELRLTLIREGILMIQEGVNPRVIRMHLAAFLPDNISATLPDAEEIIKAGRPERIDTSSPEEIIKGIVYLAHVARREGGVMPLYGEIELIEDEYMASGLRWYLDVMDSTPLRYTLEQKAKWSSQHEKFRLALIREGILMLQSGENPYAIRTRLAAWLPDEHESIDRVSVEEIIKAMVDLAHVVRQKGGVTELKEEIEQIKDADMRLGLQLAVDGAKPQLIRHTLEDKAHWELWREEFRLTLIREGILMLRDGEHFGVIEIKLASFLSDASLAALPTVRQQTSERIDTSSPEEIIKAMVDFARVARREGFPGLEARIEELEIEDEYMKLGLELAVAGVKPESIRSILEGKAMWAGWHEESRLTLIREGISLLCDGYSPRYVMRNLSALLPSTREIALLSEEIQKKPSEESAEGEKQSEPEFEEGETLSAFEKLFAGVIHALLD